MIGARDEQDIITLQFIHLEIMAKLTIKSCSRSRVPPLQYRKLHCSVVKKKTWTEEAMENATKDVIEETLSVRCVAVQYYIPPSTLHDCISGKVSAGGVSGTPHYLDESEEKELVEFLLGGAKVGYAKTVKAVRVIVNKAVTKK